MNTRTLRRTLTGLVISLGAAQGASASLLGDLGVAAARQAGGPGFALTIVHINDHHSNLEADTGADLDFDGQETRVTMGGFPRVVSKINELTANAAHPLKIHAGDAITGTLLYSVFKGEADAALMNEVCFDTFTLGNHEFDDGDAGLRDFLDHLNNGGCGTQVLAANVVPAVGTPLAPETSQDYIKPYTIKSYGDERVGIVGIDIANKTRNSSSPLDSTRFLDETASAQQAIDELEAQGVDKIVLATHFQYANDLELARSLRGVDVIVGGDSHTLLGDFEDFGLNTSGPYPTRVTDLAGNTVCVAQAWQYSAVVGELNVVFDANGNVQSCNGTPHLLLGDTFQREPADGGDRVELSGEARQEVLDTIAATPQLGIVTPNAAAQATLEGFTAQVDSFKDDPVGVASEDLCLERIPGQGRSQICDVSETAAHGGDIQQLVAFAFLNRSFRADIALQNSGGVRIDIPAGTVTIGDAYTLLPFANTMVEVVMTGEEVRRSVEEGVEFATQEDGSTGAYPYAAGMRWDVDLSRPFGQRVFNVEVRPKGSDTWQPLDPNAEFIVVVNSFMAGGGDGYTTLEEVVEDPNRESVDTFIDYAQGFIDYVQQDLGGVIDKLPVAEYSTQRFYDENGQLQQ